MKILWTIDSHCLDEGVQRCAIAALKSLIARAKAEVYPIYLYVPSSIELSSSFDADGLRWVREQAQGVINGLLNGTERAGIRPVKVLLQLPAGNNPLHAITGYGESIGADVILAATHARTGYPKLIHGSFVETLLLHSTIPLLTVSPKTRLDGPLEDLVFATDYSEEAKLAFPRALEFARALGLRMTLFHLGRGGRDEAAAWIEAARAAGVPCSRLEDPSGDSLVSRLADLASVPGRILALATHAAPSAPRVGTSVTRDLIEQSLSPLWSFRPPATTGSASGTAAAI